MLSYPKIKLFIPFDRLPAINTKVKEKLETIMNHPSLSSEIMGLPDFGDDGFGLNGLYFQTRGVAFPAAIGDDSGCGYRLLHLPKSRTNRKKIEEEYLRFGERITSEYAGFEINEIDVNEIFFNPIRWLKKKRINTFTNELFQDFNYQYPSLIFMKDIVKSFGRIARGNHFIEFRVAEEIKETKLAKRLQISKGDTFIHIHSGSGTLIEDAIFSHWECLYKKQSLPQNGFLIEAKLSDEKTQMYLEDMERAYRLAYANRCILTHLIEKWLNKKLNVLLDVAHDRLIVKNETVDHFKAVQTYQIYRNTPIAVIPSMIEGDSFLVKKKGEFPYINHGVGDGEDGKEPSISTILNNFVKPIQRKFYNAQSVMELSKSLDWYQIIAVLTPWICIKNQGEW